MEDQDKMKLYEKIHNQIQVGDVFKNQRDLFRKLGIPEKVHGNARIRWIAKIKCFMDYEKAGECSNKIIVTAVYDDKNVKDYHCPTVVHKTVENPNENLERLKENKSCKYQYSIFMLLQSYAQTQLNQYNFTIGCSELMNELGFVNSKYPGFVKKLFNEINSFDYSPRNGKSLRLFKERYFFYCNILDVIFNGIIRGKNDFGIFRDNNLLEYHKEYLVKDPNTNLTRIADQTEKQMIKIITDKKSTNSHNIYTIKKRSREILRGVETMTDLEYIGKINHFLINKEFKMIPLDSETKSQFIQKNNQAGIIKIEKYFEHKIQYVYDGYAVKKMKYPETYIHDYPFNCGSIDECIKLMNDYIDEYVVIK